MSLEEEVTFGSVIYWIQQGWHLCPVRLKRFLLERIHYDLWRLNCLSCINSAGNYFFFWQHVVNSTKKKSINEVSGQTNEKLSHMVFVEDIESALLIATVFNRDIAFFVCGALSTSYLVGMSQFLRRSTNNECSVNVVKFFKQLKSRYKKNIPASKKIIPINNALSHSSRND